MENILSSGTVLTLNLGVRLPWKCYKLLLRYPSLLQITNSLLSFHLQENPSSSRTSEETLHSDRPMRVFIEPQLSCLLISCVVPSLVKKLARGRHQSQIGRKMCICLILSSVRFYHLVEYKVFINLSKVFKVKFQFRYITTKRKSVTVGSSWCNL